MKSLFLSLIFLLLVTGCETTSHYYELGPQMYEKLSHVEIGMSLESFLTLFPGAKLYQNKIDVYSNTSESYVRKDYTVDYNWGESSWYFSFADGFLNNFSKSY
tara:strand:- start:8528 stop:8836 length:309 start_codon:yes stop_codon:yes gene_type:complete